MGSNSTSTRKIKTTKKLRMIEVGSILLAAVSVFGMGWTYYFTCNLTLSRIDISATNGCIAFLTAPAPYPKTGWSLETASRHDFIWIPAYVKDPWGSALAIPLWIPAAIAAYLAFVFHRGCRTFSGRCQYCSYDLTGNVSGVCPECGTESFAVVGKESP